MNQLYSIHNIMLVSSWPGYSVHRSFFEERFEMLKLNVLQENASRQYFSMTVFALPDTSTAY